MMMKEKANLLLTFTVLFLVFVTPGIVGATIISVNQTGGGDVFVLGGAYSGSNFGTEAYLSVGGDGSAIESRTYLRFNLSFLSSNNTISNATLYIVESPLHKSTSLITNIYEVNDTTQVNGWSETAVSWDTQPCGGSVTALNASCNSTSMGVKTIADSNSTYTFDVTPAARNGLNRVSKLVLLLLENLTDQGVDTLAYFGSREQSANVTAYLEITTAGLETCTGTNTLSRRLIFLNETSPFASVNSTANGYLYTSNINDTVMNFTITNTTHNICIGSATANFSVYGQVQYEGNVSGSYSVRDYFFDNQTFDSSYQDINLYQLPSASATQVKFTLKDQYANAYPNAVIKIQRWYPELNSYYTVAQPKTNDQGQTFVYLVLSNVYYRFVIQKDGAILETKPAQLLSSTDITLTVNPVTLSDYLRYWNKIGGNITYDSTTNNVTATYSDTSGYLTKATLNVTRIGALTKVSLCSKANATTPNGTIVCYVGNASGQTLSWQLDGYLTDGSIHNIFNGLSEVGSQISRLFGSCTAAENALLCHEGLMLTFFLTLLAATLGAYNPTVSLITMLGGLSVSVFVGLFAITVQTLVGLMFVGAVIIYVMRNRQ